MASPTDVTVKVRRVRKGDLSRMREVLESAFGDFFERQLGTRPRKVFLTKLHVFAGDNRYIGTIRQQNVFWKIRFSLHDEIGRIVGHLRAENVRAWDFHIYDLDERPAATIAKSWEGWSRTAFTRAATSRGEKGLET